MPGNYLSSNSGTGFLVRCTRGEKRIETSFAIDDDAVKVENELQSRNAGNRGQQSRSLTKPDIKKFGGSKT